MTSTPTNVHQEHYDVATAQTGWLYHALRVGGYAKTISTSSSLLWNFLRRDLLGRFRGSFGGFFWVLVQPLFLFCVYFAVFGILFAPRASLDSGPDPFFAVYLFAGIIMFTAISEGVTSGLTAVTGNANLVKKVRFPCELLPIVPVLVAAVVYAVGCVVLVIMGLAFDKVNLSFKLLLWPVLVVIMIGMTTGIGLLLAAANVFVRDIQHLFRVITMAWFFLTPNFWQFDMLEDKFSTVGMGWIETALLFNPATPLVLANRQVFGMGDDATPELYAEVFPMTLTENLLAGLAWAVFFLFVGYGLFKSRRHKFADLV